MGRVRGTKLSPATVISIVALVFAVAGTAMAGVATYRVLSKTEKNQTRKIARHEIGKAAPEIARTEIGKAAPGLSVANAAQLGGRPPGDYLAAQSRGVALAGAKIDGSGNLKTWFNVLGGAPTVSPDCSHCWIIAFPGLSNSDQDVVQGTLDSPGELEVDPTQVDGHGVFIQTFNSSGVPAARDVFVVVYGASGSG
jgi:hypothetical protein